jgi:hypothetical protein
MNSVPDATSQDTTHYDHSDYLIYSAESLAVLTTAELAAAASQNPDGFIGLARAFRDEEKFYGNAYRAVARALTPALGELANHV